MRVDLGMAGTRTMIGGWLLALGAVALPAGAAAQGLYTPHAVKEAYAHGTRSPDGRPGPKYWQNHARYTISVATNPPDRKVTGTEQVTYFNNSPDTLRSIVIRLLVNIHKPGAPRAGGAGEDYLTSGVHIDAFGVNGQATPWVDNGRYFTWQPVRLAAPLMPHDSVRLSFDWHYDMSRQSGREGAIDSTTFFLAYFYPRVAVYDDVNGWDTHNFDDALEFYSDFNDYDVTVKVPANYVVWGTGRLENASDVLQPAVVQRLQASERADTTITIATAAQLAAGSVTAQQAVNAWHFTASNIPDMTYAISNHYDWDATSVVVDDATGRRAGAQAAYNDTASDFHHMARYARHALDWLSHQWPGVPYPYEKTTVVQGFAGMEYPMMVNDESYPDTVFSRFVAEHEIAHTWFPFYMGINETRHAFMDEGWATTFEYLVSVADIGQAQATKNFQQFRASGGLNELPIITPYTSGSNGYGKPAQGYLAMKDLLGDALFQKALHGYIDRWHGKHPVPWDFFNSFNNITGRNLDWFWRSWFFGNDYIDIGIASVTRAGNGYRVVLNNVGGMPAPVDMKLTFTDGTTSTLHQTPAIWQANLRRASIMVPARKRVKSIALDGGIWVDDYTADNTWNAR